PYVKNNRIEGIPRNWKAWLSNHCKAEIIALPSCRSPIFQRSKENTVSIKISGDKGPHPIISAYSSPAENITFILQEIKGTMRNISNEKALVGVDLKAHNRRWGYSTDDNRGITTEEFIEFNHFNTSDAEPFSRGNSIGWPDLTMTQGASLANKNIWEV
ncbi:hypothetical protein AVEN_118668-2-1, partial [Araneus ventricosus]